MISKRTEYRTWQQGWNMMIDNEGILVDGGILPKRAGSEDERTLRGEDVAFLQEYVYCLYRYITTFYPPVTTLGDEVTDLPSAFKYEDGDTAVRAGRLDRLVSCMRELAGSGLFLKSEPGSVQTAYSIVMASAAANNRVTATLGPASDLVSKLGLPLVTEPDMDPGMKDVKPGDAVGFYQMRAMFASAAKLRFPIFIGYHVKTGLSLDVAGGGTATVDGYGYGYASENISYRQSSGTLETRWVGGMMDGMVNPATSSPGSTTVPEAGPISFTETGTNGSGHAVAMPVRGFGADAGGRVVFVAQAVASCIYRRPRTVNDVNEVGEVKHQTLVTITGVGTATLKPDSGFSVESDALYPPNVLVKALGNPIEAYLPEPPAGTGQVQTIYASGASSPPNGNIGGGYIKGTVRFIRIAIAGTVSDDIDFEKAYADWESRLTDE